VVSRAKSDPGDAQVLANILPTDLAAHRPVPDDSELDPAGEQRRDFPVEPTGP
jgi:hypothetical protein